MMAGKTKTPTLKQPEFGENSRFLDQQLLNDLMFEDEALPKQKRARESRYTIVRAALEAFSARGFEGVSTHEVAATAGVTQGLVTYHFKSKEGLWRAAMDMLFGDFRKQLAAKITQLNEIEDPIFYKLIFRHIIRWPTQYPFVVRMMMISSSSKDDHLTWLVDRHVRPVYAVVSTLLDQAKAAGLVKNIPTLNVYFLMMTAASVFSLGEEIKLLSGKDVSTPAFVETHTEMLLTMIFNEA